MKPPGHTTGACHVYILLHFRLFHQQIIVLVSVTALEQTMFLISG